MMRRFVECVDLRVFGLEKEKATHSSRTQLSD